MTTIEALVLDAGWEAIEPLLPPPPPRCRGHPCIEDHAALAGIITRLHRVLLDELGRSGQLDWSRVSLDSLSTCPMRGAS